MNPIVIALAGFFAGLGAMVVISLYKFAIKYFNREN